MEQSLPARGRELGLIEDALSSLSSGAGRVVLVSGSAGAGKTTLLRAALGDPVGVRVLSGRAYRFQIPVAFGPIVEALGPSMRADADVERLTANLHSLASLFDGLPLVPPEHGDASLQRPRLLHALHTLIHRMATHGPVAVAIDDAQWADNATVEFLSLLAESVHDVPVAVLLGVRHDDHDANEQATRFFTRVRRDGAAQVTLEPLDAAGVSDVVASVLGEGRVPPELIRLLLERTGGTPLYLVEALSQMQQQGDVTRVGAAWQFNGTRIPPSTFGPDLMAGRLAGSTEDEQEILQMLALHGEPIAETELVALGVDTSRLGPLARRRLVVESVIEGVPRWSLEHPVLADVIVEQLTTTDRQARHERLARLFVTNDPDRFAHHLLGAGERAVRVVGSEVAVARALRSAGELALRRGELIEATDLLTATLGWVREPRPDPLAAAITSELAIAWHDRGHHGIARQLAREAMDECLSIGDVDGALGAAEVLANALFLANIHDQTWIEELAQRVAEEGTDLQRLGIRFRQFAIASRSGAQVPVDDEPMRSFRELASSDDESVARHAEMLLELDERLRSATLQQLAELYGRFANEPTTIDSFRAVGWNGLIETTMAQGRWDESEQLERDYLEWVDSTRVPRTWRLAVLRWNRLLARADVGAALQTEFEFGYAAARNPRVTALHAYQLVATHDAAGDLAALEDPDLIATIESCLASGERGTRRYIECAHLMRVALVGDLDAVAAAPRPALGLHDGLPLASYLANAVADVARRDLEAVRQSTDALRAVDPDGVDLPHALANRLDGEVALRVGDAELGARLLRRAHSWFIERGLPIEAARSAVLLEPFDPVDDAAVVDLEQRLRELDVSRRADQLALLLRQRGLFDGQSGDDSSTPAERLSKRERQVAELVMAGMTNREVADQLFISVRTVTSHLDHIYTKLGVSSRQDLAPILRSDAIDLRSEQGHRSIR